MSAVKHELFTLEINTDSLYVRQIDCLSIDDPRDKLSWGNKQ